MLLLKGRVTPKATLLTAFMREECLLVYGFTREEIEAGLHLPPVGGGVGNSSQIITDLTTAIATALSTTALANATNANGPIMDLSAMMRSVLLNAQEMVWKLNYMLGGSMVAPASLTAPTGGPITSAADGTIYNLLVGVFQILK
jgi:hypothetical protein